MPLPMVPAPITPTRLMSMKPPQSRGLSRQSYDASNSLLSCAASFSSILSVERPESLHPLYVFLLLEDLPDKQNSRRRHQICRPQCVNCNSRVPILETDANVNFHIAVLAYISISTLITGL